MITKRTEPMIFRSAAQTHYVSSILITVATICALSSCDEGGKEREYAIPDRLCGRPITSDIADFLPPGNDISMERETHTATTVCEVAVDHKLVLTTTTAWRSANDSTASFAQRALAPTKHSAEEGRFRYSGSEAFGRTQNCVAHDGDRALFTAVQALGSEHRDAEAMKRLITSFTASVEKSQECRAEVP